MMRKVGIILSLTAVLVLMTSLFSTASALELERTYPEDGYENAAVDNFGMKLYFDQDLINAENEKANADRITVTDEDGETIPTLIIYSEKEKGLVMVLADVTGKDRAIKQASKYTVTVSGDFTAANGETLGKDTSIRVKTLDQSKSTKVNMIMMLVMCVGMVAFSTRSAKKQQEEAARARREEEKVNPYKVAKETGKSVEEIVEQDRKRKEKQAAAAEKKARKEKEQEELLAEEEEETYSSVRRVKRARAVTAAESPYVEKREKEAAARRAAEKAKGTTNPKKAGGKKRGNRRK